MPISLSLSNYLYKFPAAVSFCLQPTKLSCPTSSRKHPSSCSSSSSSPSSSFWGSLCKFSGAHSLNMTSVCAEQHHKFHASHPLFPSTASPTKKALDIPPRRLLSRRPTTTAESPDMFADYSPRVPETSLQKFLPYNTASEDSDDSDSDPFSSDHFRMFEFKVRRCTRSRSHDWTDCPFAHPGEKARRRDPRKYHYSGTVCAEHRRGSCSRGDNCEFAHGVFECWLHPSRYRTEACKDGKNCKRKVCFFAHTPRQLRVLPLQSETSPQENTEKTNYRSPNPLSPSPLNHCCMFCHSVTSSPKSTLLGLSHLSPPLSPSQSLSPPLSPLKSRSLSGFSPVSRYVDRFAGSADFSCLNPQGLSYKDVLNEIMTSLDAMKMNEGSNNLHASPPPAKNRNRCVDVSNTDHEQTQFILSPCTTNYQSQMGMDFFGGDYSSQGLFCEEKVNEGSEDPDLGWVNELLM